MIPVLIVEDEFLVRVGLRSMVEWEKYGFYVAADASNGEKGLQMFLKYRPRLIFTDIRMSPMDGLEMMKEIRKIDNSVKFIIISAYSEFEYAQQAIRQGVELYLDKAAFSDGDIAAVLQKTASELESEKAPPGFTSPVGAPDFFSSVPALEAEEALRSYFISLGFFDCPFILAACRYDRSVTPHENPNLLLTIFTEVASKEGIVHSLYRHNEFIIGLLDARNLPAVEKAVTLISGTLKKYTSPHVYFGLSSVFTEPRKIHRALSEACKTCNNFLFDKSVPIRHYENDPFCRDGENCRKILVQDLQSCIFSGNRDGIDRLIRDAVFASDGYRELEKNVFSILLCLEEFDKSIIIAEMLGSIMRRDSLEDICQALTRWAQGLGPPESERSDYIDEIINYVQNNLDSNISLKALAAKYHLSPNYLGRLFFQKTGSYLNAFVAKSRMNKACELIRGTNLSIKEIGQMVGVDNPHYFSKLFKDHMGVSPNRYKNG